MRDVGVDAALLEWKGMWEWECRGNLGMGMELCGVGIGFRNGDGIYE